jgi:hypothetical protein
MGKKNCFYFFFSLLRIRHGKVAFLNMSQRGFNMSQISLKMLSLTFSLSYTCMCDMVALHLPRQAVASLDTLSIKESVLGILASALLGFGHLAMHNKRPRSLCHANHASPWRIPINGLHVCTHAHKSSSQISQLLSLQ